MRDQDASSGTGDDPTIWEESPLGSLARWPESLRAYFLTISALPHPSAIYWGEDQLLLQNKPWTEAHSSSKGQGQPQKEVLSHQLRETLQSIINSGLSQELRDGAQFTELTSGKQNVSVAILSQLHPKGVLVQLIHYQSPRKHVRSRPSSSADFDIAQHKTIQDKNIADEETGRPSDKIPIDEHPFFRRFAELLPSGLAILDKNASSLYVNRKFWDLTTLQEDEQFTSWPQSIHSDDYERVMSAYREAFAKQQELRIEFRAKDAPQPWRLLLLTPLGDEKSHHISNRDRGGFICSIVDISAEKNAELTERKAAQLARERKVQQERFIDMISHEIRNPLSAVLHCAEDISEAIGDGDKPVKTIDKDMIREALATINLCVRHQKNIVDDVLSFSKLDASLLSLKPTICEPSKALKTTLKIFQHEFRKEKLHFTFVVEPGYDSLPVNKVMADMPRIGQVLINLMTNAIKFTSRGSGEKRISCAVSATKTRPESYPPDVVFFRSENLSKMDATNNEEWGNGDPLYILVAVKDSGIGISTVNQEKLFMRFRQATPMTNVQYGGSGLGLNISRKICQLHGGEIGVASKEGEGSTFGFFFKVRTLGESDSSEKISENGASEARLRDKIQDGIEQATPESEGESMPFEWRPTPTEERKSFFNDTENEESSKAARMKKDRESKKGEKKDEEEQNGETVEMPPPKSDSPPTESESSSESKPNRPTIPRPPHILLVEDNKINQRLLSRKLEKKGFRVTTANDGREAVAKVKDKPNSGDKAAFDMILMDKEMPVLDGNAATREIREMEQRGDTERAPIIGVTANVRDEQQNEMIASGMDDVISKPYEIEEMVAKIHKVTGSREKSAAES